MSADVSELDAFADLLRAAGADALDRGERVVAKGSLNIKNDARRLAPGSAAARLYPASISYDVEVDAGGEVLGEIGPAQGRPQWGLGNLLEYGSQNNPPHPHHEPALDLEEPRFYAACEALAAELVDRHG